jgi:hypothetical protein
MVYLLFWLTTLVNVIGLALALCLGLYIVTRTPRGWLTWLAALTLCSLAAFYLYNALSVTVPGNGALLWLRPSVVLALAFGFHLSLLLPLGRREAKHRFLCPPLRLPEWLERSLGPAGAVVRQLPVPLSYAAAPILILVGAIPIGVANEPTDGPALYLSHRPPTLLYPVSSVPWPSCTSGKAGDKRPTDSGGARSWHCSLQSCLSSAVGCISALASGCKPICPPSRAM